MKLFSAEGTFRLGVAPLGDALPAEEVTAGRGRGSLALLQAQGAHGAPARRLLLCQALAAGEAAVKLPLLPGLLPLSEAIDLDAHRQQQVHQGYHPQNPIAPADTVIVPSEAAHA